MKERAFGSLVVSTVAGLFVMSAAHAEGGHAPAGKAKADGKAEAYCQNESCKGKDLAKGATAAGCKGVSGCKGKGILAVKDAPECSEKGGKWVPAKS